MRIQTLLVASFLLMGITGRAQEDPVVMTIGGEPVNLSEFEYFYDKNNSEGAIDRKSVKDFVPFFVDYKLKVRAAQDAHLDTLPSFQRTFQAYRDQQLRPLLLSLGDVEREAHKIYGSTRQRIDDHGGMIKVAQILIPLGQRASEGQQRTAERLADSLYNALRKGASFADLARRFSGDSGSASTGGNLPWMVRGQTLKEFEDAAWGLRVGEISHPVLSPAGYHIILLKDKRSFFPYDSVETDIRRFIASSGLREQLIDHKLDSLADIAQMDRETVLVQKESEQMARNPGLKYLIQEYHDGLLLYEICDRTIWNQAAWDEKELKKFFKKNKKRYRWSQPRFRGVVCYSKDKGQLEAAWKSLKGRPFEKWSDILRNTFSGDGTVRVQSGIFKQGDNALVDRDIFKVKEVPQPVTGYPYSGVFGKKLKRGPKDLSDVQPLVIVDYQDFLEKRWVDTLRKKYPVKVNTTVLATINQHHNEIMK
nr:peptidylprolyl isomerase [Prevotella sp. UBA5379]